jgi:hypothetical protein
MIEARGLTKRYGPVVAVDGLSFDVAPGKVTGLLGAERRGEVHHDAADPWAGCAGRWDGDGRGAPVPGAAAAAI